MKTHKNMNNVEIADLLRAVAAAYEIEGKNRFKVIAYERAADAVEHLSSEAKDLWDDDKLEDVSGIGKSIAEHLTDIFSTGKSEHFEKILSKVPPSVYEMIKVPGIGPKNAIKFASTLGIVSAKNAISRLEAKAKKGEIAKMPGFGEDSQQSIIESIQDYRSRDTDRILISRAEEIGQSLVDWLNKSEHVRDVDVLGSLRRKASTVGDIDIAVSTKKPDIVIKHFCDYPNKSRILESGKRTASLILPGNIQVDLMVETPDAYGSLLQHFTGSKHHNIALREYAIKKGWKVSDYGITKKDKLIKVSNEKEFYSELNMDYIPPELRQDKGEIKASIEAKLPKLVELSDIKADLHMHSNFDIETSHDLGASSIKQMAEAAEKLGYEYIALTEHNPSQKGHSQKQVRKLLRNKKDKIYTHNEAVKNGVKVFNSLEIDILPNGSLPVSDENLDILDFALVSIHSSFKKSRRVQTERVLNALVHPKVKIFAHPTARKLLEREGVELDWDKIFDFCLEHDKWIEINAEPHRLDLPDHLVYEAIKKGVKLTLGTDSHHKDGLVNMKYGVYVARRGWAEKENIVNTLRLKEFEKLLAS